MISTQNRSDFTITDFYNHVADSRAVRTLDRDIVILDIGDCDREEIAQLLELVSYASPRAVGVDILFEEPHDNDSLLISSLQALPNLVMAADAESAANGRFRLGLQSFMVDSLPNYTPGIINFPSTNKDITIREFQAVFPTATDSLESFALALARLTDDNSLGELRSRGNSQEVINFCSRSFTVIRPDELYDRAEELTDKVVLVGSLNQGEDMHITPVRSAMSGIEIHAYALATILNHSYFMKVNRFWNWVIAISSCLFVLTFSMFIPLKVKGLTMRIFQLLILYLTIRYGYELFISYNIIVNFSYSLLMITFGLLASDFWLGTEHIIRSVAPHAKNYFRNPIKTPDAK